MRAGLGAHFSGFTAEIEIGSGGVMSDRGRPMPVLSSSLKKQATSGSAIAGALVDNREEWEKKFDDMTVQPSTKANATVPVEASALSLNGQFTVEDDREEWEKKLEQEAYAAINENEEWEKQESIKAHPKGYAAAIETGNGPVNQKPVLSSHAHASKPASLGYAAEIETVSEGALGQKPVLSSHAHASKPASLRYAAEIETVSEGALGQKPVLSSHAHASKPASLGYAAEIETMDEANVKPKPDLDKPREKFDMEAWKKRQAQMLAETQASLELARKTQELERERIAKNEAEKAAKAAQIKADLEARAAEAAAAKAAADEEAAKLEAKRLKEEAIAQEAATAQQKADQEAAEAAAAEKAAAEKAEADKQAALVG